MVMLLDAGGAARSTDRCEQPRAMPHNNGQLPSLIVIIISMVSVSLRMSPDFYDTGIVVITGVLTVVVTLFIWIHKHLGLHVGYSPKDLDPEHAATTSSSRSMKLMCEDDRESMLVLNFLLVFRTLLSTLLVAMIVLNAMGMNETWTQLYWWRVFTYLAILVHIVNRYSATPSTAHRM